MKFFGGSRAEGGFTFSEVLVVVCILSVALLGIAAAISNQVRALAVSDERRLAVRLAQDELEEIIGRGDAITSSDAGDFGPDYPEIEWEYDIQGPNESGLYRIEVEVRWIEQGKPRSETLTTYHPLKKSDQENEARSNEPDQ